MSALSLPSRPVLAVAALAAVLLAGCGHEPQATKAKPFEVFATTPIVSEVTDYQDFTGRLSAVKAVDIRPRVTGYVMEADFKEGDLVKEGDVLFRIDGRSYKADYNQAVANFKLAEAERNLQEKISQRSTKLYGTRAVSQEEYETALATVEKARATVASMRATRDRTQLYLDWTVVKAPLSGRVSRRLVDPGNLVNADTTILTTIVTENPLYAYFDVDERTFLNLSGKKLPSAEVASSLESARLPVLMRLANEDEFVHLGTVNFIDNQAVATTGTVRFRGVFANPHLALKPGLFARIRLPVGSPYQAVLVPDEALMSDQGRKYVYVIQKQKDKKGEEAERVVYRKVTPGQAVVAKKKQKNAVGEEELVDYVLRVIHPPAQGKAGQEGLAVGERVVVVGMQRVRPGAPVTVKMMPAPPPPQSPFGKLVVFNAPAAQPAAPADPGARPQGRDQAGPREPRLKGAGRPTSGRAARGG